MTVATHNGAQELAVQAGALAIKRGQTMWDDKQRAALAVLGIKNATNGDLAVFMHYCQKTGLDPFSRQIYMIERREKQGGDWVAKQTIQVGIDGFRVIRDRIADRLGIDVEYEDTIWYDADGQPHDVWLSEDPPVACRVVVIKNGRRFPGVVRTAAYAATNKDGAMVAQWRNQPDHMIEKCAEAFALRRAFPNDLGGMYIDDEMAAAPEPPPVQVHRVTAADITRPGSGAAASPAAAPADAPGPAVAPRGTGPGATNVPEPAGAVPTAQQERPPASGEATGSGTPRKRLTKPLLGRVQGTLHALPLGSGADVAELLTALAGRPVQRADGLYADEAGLVLAVIDEELEAADGETTAAAAGVRTRVKALLAAQEQDAAAEGQPSDA